MPTAAAYVFTLENPPYSGAPPLVPLYRLRYDVDIAKDCEDPPGVKDPNRDFAYTTDKQRIIDFLQLGYNLDGIEGYVYKTCSPEPGCIPAGAVPLYQLYNSVRVDHVLFPKTSEAELQYWLGQGYSFEAGLPAVLGYVYPNVDTDGDNVIDGFEGILGTDPGIRDTDGDGRTDGQEALVYDLASHGYGDPLVGFETIFADGFETGDTSGWSATVGGQ